ncbi:MAG: hypothetical protein JWL59_2215 [Chthoniobacteraceae bacterium]|nr:hypothetical protein [Chthoniobacteraceae bacterium]
MRFPLVMLAWSATGFVLGYAAFHPGWKERAPLRKGVELPNPGPISNHQALVSVKDRLDRVWTVCAQPDGLAKNSALYEALQALQAADFLAALEEPGGLITKLDKLDRTVSLDFIQTCLERWLELDETGALHALEKIIQAVQPTRREFEDETSRVISVLAQRNPQWLFEHIPRIPLETPQRIAIAQLLEQSGQSNPRKALEWLETFRGKKEWPLAVGSYVRGLAYSDPQGAIERAAAEFKEKDRDRAFLISSVYLNAVRRMPSLSVNLLSKLESSERPELAWDALEALDEEGKVDPLEWIQKQVAAYPELLDFQSADHGTPTGALMRASPIRSLEWLKTLPFSQSGEFIGVTVNAWDDRDPAPLFDWLDSLPAEVLAKHMGELGSSPLIDAERLRKWLANLPPGEVRNRAHSDLADVFVAKGRLSDARRDFPRDADTESLLWGARSLASATASKDIAAATAWVGTLPPGRVQTYAARGVVETWANESPEKAAQWVQSLPRGCARESALQTLALEFSVIDPEGAGLWLDQISDTFIRNKAIKELFTRWESKEPRRAREWLNQVPGIDAELKAKLLRRPR